MQTPHFLSMMVRARRAGDLCSIFGVIAPPGQTAYAASKFAVRGFSEVLRHELEAAGSPIGVTVVHPGGVRTAIATSARRSGMSTAETAAQAELWKRFLRLSPDAAAERIARGIERREKRVLVGRDAQRIAAVQRLFPVEYWRVLDRSRRKRAKAAPLG